MKTLIFETEGWINLTPVSYLRPVFELRCGYHSMLERIRTCLPDTEFGLWTRDYLAPMCRKKYGIPVNDPSYVSGEIVLINGQWLMSATDELITDKERIFVSGEDIVYAKVAAETIKKHWKGDLTAFLAAITEELPKTRFDARLVRYPWNLIHYNPEVLREDFRTCGKRGVEGIISPHAVIYGPKEDVYIARGAEIHPLVVLDTSAGPIYIERGARVYPNTRIEGPCYIGEDTYIMPCSSIREGNSFGPVCRIGGEVEESIFHSYSNKYHDGFIGHSYIGEFVNLGALTTNSDLKNDYSSVSVYVNGTPMDTGDMKVGSFIGDHTKTSIGTLFNTGSSIGVMCNITAGGILPKFFPSFIWYVNNRYMKGYGVDMMIETARMAMERRKRMLLKEEEQAIRAVYEMTRDLRQTYINKSRRMTKG